MYLENIDAFLSIVHILGVVVPDNIAHVALHVVVVIVFTILVPCLKLHSFESHENSHLIVKKGKTTDTSMMLSLLSPSAE